VKGGLRGRIRDPLLRLLQQGVSAERLALCVAIGVVVGNIPILGTSTLLCAAIALLFRLNLAAMLVAPAATFLIYKMLAPAFDRAARRITGGVRPQD
jgi:uncharacterized protein (DUF2062 family)